MQAFILKEAQEKAKEIKLKADEEYEIEKASIVRSEISAIDESFSQKIKKASLTQQITKSKLDNKTRLRVLSTKEKVLNDVFNDTETELRKLTKDSKKFKPILNLLIEEALLIILEDEATLTVRESDLELAKSIIDDVKTNFKEKAKFDVSVSFSSDYLPSDSIGGVIASNTQGNITADNTLDERLKLLSNDALPVVRLELFGINKTRKFFD